MYTHAHWHGHTAHSSLPEDELSRSLAFIRNCRVVSVVRGVNTEPARRERFPERAEVGAPKAVRICLDPRVASGQDCCKHMSGLA